uniref:Uncharacterized protein n=2 Tax=Aegilops tauschii subsp. strangulata TaxID=200361 RepID=A0A453IDI4_AEGTS
DTTALPSSEGSVDVVFLDADFAQPAGRCLGDEGPVDVANFAQQAFHHVVSFGAMSQGRVSGSRCHG